MQYVHVCTYSTHIHFDCACMYCMFTIHCDLCTTSYIYMCYVSCVSYDFYFYTW